MGEPEVQKEDGVQRDWLVTLYTAAVTAVAVGLSLIFSHLTRVFSLCMFAAGGLVDNMIGMAERSNLASLDGLRILLSTHKSWLISVLTATGFLLQTSIYL